jgi:hypothetical protein
MRSSFVESPAHLLSQPYRSVWLFLRSSRFPWVLWTYVRDCYCACFILIWSLCACSSPKSCRTYFERQRRCSIAGVLSMLIASFLTPSCRFICMMFVHYCSVYRDVFSHILKYLGSSLRTNSKSFFHTFDQMSQEPFCPTPISTHTDRWYTYQY